MVPSQFSPDWKEWTAFANRFSPQKRARDYHAETKERLKLAQIALNCMAANYDNSPKFRCSLCAFLTQCKSAVDSLAEEINIHYSLVPNKLVGGRIHSLSADGLIGKKGSNLTTLRNHNSALATLVATELQRQTGWYQTLKTLRDEEAIHGVRFSRHLVKTIGTPTQIGIKTEKLDIPDLSSWCQKTIRNVYSFLERCYSLM